MGSVKATGKDTDSGAAMRIDEYNSFESLLHRYRAALRRLEGNGIKVADGCRLRSYEIRLDQLLRDPRAAVEPEVVFAATFDLREVDEVIEITDHLPDSLDTEILQLLRKLASGNEHPDDDSSAPAREAQYELYLGAVLRRAGISVKHGAPDLVASWLGEDFFIEAKRPASEKRFDDRLRSAVHQIRRLPRPGIIAICADQLLRPTGGLMGVKTHNDLASTVQGLVGSFILGHAQILRHRLDGEQVAALLWTARLPARIDSTGHSALGTSLHLEMLSPGTREVDFASTAIRAYQDAQNNTNPG
jgi:hypothetical protein